MGKITTIALIAGGYLAWHFYKTKKAVSNLQISLEGLEVNKLKLGLSNSLLQIKLAVYNPEDVNLAFNSFHGSIMSGENELAQFNVQTPGHAVIIKKNSISKIPLSAHIVTLNAFEALLNAGTMQNLSIVGTIKINGVNVPVELNDSGNDNGKVVKKEILYYN